MTAAASLDYGETSGDCGSRPKTIPPDFLVWALSTTVLAEGTGLVSVIGRADMLASITDSSLMSRDSAGSLTDEATFRIDGALSRLAVVGVLCGFALTEHVVEGMALLTAVTCDGCRKHICRSVDFE